MCDTDLMRRSGRLSHYGYCKHQIYRRVIAVIKFWKRWKWMADNSWEKKYHIKWEMFIPWMFLDETVVKDGWGWWLYIELRKMMLWISFSPFFTVFALQNVTYVHFHPFQSLLVDFNPFQSVPVRFSPFLCLETPGNQILYRKPLWCTWVAFAVKPT